MGFTLVCERRRTPAKDGGFPIAVWYVPMCALLKIRPGGLFVTQNVPSSFLRRHLMTQRAWREV